MAELSDAEVFGTNPAPPGPPRELSDAEVFGTGLEGFPEEAFQADYARHPITIPVPAAVTDLAAYREPGTDLTDIEPRDGAATRIVGAIDEGFRKGASAGTDIQGQPLLTGLMRQGGGVLGAVGGAFGQGAYELGNLWSPEAGRDAYMGAQVVGSLWPLRAKIPSPTDLAAAPRVSPMMEGFDRAGAPARFVSERTAPDVSQLDPRNAIQTLIEHDIRENPPPAPDRGTPNQGSSLQPTEPASAPTVATPAMSGAAGVPPAGTAAYAKNVASAYYDIADKSGGTLTPQFTNKFIDSVSSAGKQTEAGQAAAGQNAVSGLAERLQTLKDKPMTLAAAQEVDEALGDLIDKEYSVKGLSKDGRKIAQIQGDFRDMIQNANEGDITGGTAGFDALGPARKAWSQAMKMDDLERIQQRAEMTDNPATSVRTQIRTLVNNPTKSRGYSPEEIDALKAAADRGVVGSALHVFGSRLVPLAAGAGFLHGGPVAGAASAGVAHGVSSALRAGATGIARRRLNRAMKTLGSGVPPNPLFNPDAVP